jgi:CSLREA domain-containing protein
VYATFVTLRGGANALRSAPFTEQESTREGEQSILRSAASKVVWRPTATTTIGMWVALVGMLVAGVVALAASASPAQAETTFTVNSTSDSLGEANPGDGKCENGSLRERCTLRDAIEEANAFPGDDTIVIPAGIGTTIRLSPLSPQVTLPPLSITSNLTIDGPGAGALAVDGNDVNRVFNVGSGAVVRIEGLTITGGKPPDGEAGGGILNEGTLTLVNSTISGNSAKFTGGGIYNPGTLTLTNSTISGNSADDIGGGIVNSSTATLTVTNSTISGNSAKFAGGGIYNILSTLTLTNSTVSDNRVSDSGDSSIHSRGGGIYNLEGTATLTNSTFSGNSASDAGGGIYNSDDGTANLSNTILANSPSGGNCSNGGTLNDQGYNIEDGTSCSFSEANNSMPSTEPLLGELANNGGPTQTHALEPRSPAINAIPSATNGCATTIATDQRRVKRPQGGKCEIGSFEDRSPWVKRVVPQEDTTGISPRKKVSGFFSEEMRPRSITVKTFKLFEQGNTTRIEAQVEYDASTKRAILTPEEPLELGKSYRVKVNTGVQDLASNLLDQDKDPSNGNQPKSWRFKVR